MEKSKMTLVLLKPTAVERGLVGEIIGRFERSGLVIKKIKLEQFPEKTFEELYEEHEGKPFYSKIVSWMASRPILALALTGNDQLIKKVRSLIGKTDPVDAKPGTIRGDLACSLDPDNLVHASDSPESAERELKLFFPELFN